MNRLWWLALGLLWLAGCARVEYLHQAWQGQREVMRLAVPVADILADPEADPALQARLALALEARRFASEQLGLPDNLSYTRYAQLPRSYVLWNVFVTPELSLKPVEHCYPLAGCIAYRGYFNEARAEAEAKRWQARGMDVYVGPVPAYSTLGWYDDPLLSSMMHWGDDYLAGLIFHELAHQHFYVRDDTSFNESYASFVEQQGLRQWREQRGQPAEDPRQARQGREFTELMLETRRQLAQLYASELDDQAKREGKQQMLTELQQRYQDWRDQRWNGSRRFDGWFVRPLNNASLLPFGLYDQWVPAFERLFQQLGEDWPAFHAEVKVLGGVAAPQRRQRLEALLGEAASCDNSNTAC